MFKTARMTVIALKIKHAGKTYDVPDVDTGKPGSAFKEQIYQLTGVRKLSH